MSEVPLQLSHQKAPGVIADETSFTQQVFERGSLRCARVWGGRHTPVGPYRRPMPRVLGGSSGVGRFLIGEVPLYGWCRTWGAGYEAWGYRGTWIIRIPPPP